MPSEESENEPSRERELSGRAALESATEAELLDVALDRVLEVAFATPLPAVDLRVPVRDAGEDRGAVLGGRYQLEELLGEGGMGSVWRAKQTEPVEREVALKLIKKGMDSRLIVSRFDAERQTLALMDHPHIARVFDGGLAPDGRRSISGAATSERRWPSGWNFFSMSARRFSTPTRKGSSIATSSHPTSWSRREITAGQWSR
ncbi:MAG: hypothetical protein LW697_12955 [Blastopirellula sp.]|nr:hypothetical protein [Blastopirellula sp.]